MNFGTNDASEIILDDLEFYEMPGLYQNAVMGGNFENGAGKAEQGFYTAPSNYNTILSCDGNECQSYVKERIYLSIRKFLNLLIDKKSTY